MCVCVRVVLGAICETGFVDHAGSRCFLSSVIYDASKYYKQMLKY